MIQGVQQTGRFYAEHGRGGHNGRKAAVISGMDGKDKDSVAWLCLVERTQGESYNARSRRSPSGVCRLSGWCNGKSGRRHNSPQCLLLRLSTQY